jgi:chemotaxis protein MotB
MDDDDAPAIPEWVVTFGDMMSLLLTFFIMLVSLSEIKDEERYQALVESMMQRFGYDSSMASAAPGRLTPRNAQIAKIANEGRARRLNAMQGGDKVQAPTGDHRRVHIVRPGEQTSIGTVLFFQEGLADLSEQNKQRLREAIVTLRGKPQKIDVRGHTTQRPLPKNANYTNHWELAYQRCWNTVKFLTEKQGIDRRRIRISVAGPNEPMRIASDPASQRENPRVEIFMLDETVDDLTGTKEERDKRFTDGDTP